MKNGGSLKFNSKMWFSSSDCVFVHLWMNEWIICSKKTKCWNNLHMYIVTGNRGGEK